MNLYILRHGLAVERGTPGFENDARRPLTPKGRRQLRKITDAIGTMKLRPDVILSSPLVRARQTAEIVATGLKLERRLAFADELSPGGSVKKLTVKIRALNPLPENLLLVGHEPNLSKMISLLVIGKTSAGFALKKAGLAKLEVESLRAGQCATIVWLLTPVQMKLMA
jgi:phosphohistidine phosphatase